MSMPDGELFKKRLVDTRKRRELSQEGLAKMAGLPATAISHFESGGRKPSFDNLRKLADALEVSIDYLMGRTDEISGHVLAEAEIFRDYENLTEDDREAARIFMATLAKRNKDK
tara:strand:- start:6431 stop:6772 length:342 start_codon:yes stop_codon:yes gene_type:complete